MRLLHTSSSHKMLMVSTGLSVVTALSVFGVALSLQSTTASSHKISPQKPAFARTVQLTTDTTPTQVPPKSEQVGTGSPFDAENVSDDEVALAQLTAYAPRGASTRGGRIIRVGLSTAGGPIVMLPSSQLIITDAAQAGRRLVVRAGETVSFDFGGNSSIQARGQTFTGPIRVRTSAGSYGGWRVANVWAAGGGPTAIATDGADPRGRRAFRGNFELAPQEYTFEAATHQSPLRLVNVLPLDEYLRGVVPWEMSPTAPLEALKAQAVCARSETLAKMSVNRHTRDGYDICDFDHCQGYSGTENEKPASDLAVEQTSGLVLMHNGKVADAVYGTNSGGITAASDDVWRGTPAPYLQSVRDFSPTLHKKTAQLVKAKMTEADWVKYCITNLPSFAQPNQAEIEALAARRRRTPRTAALFQENDLPEFYRWTRVITPQQLATVLREPNAIASEVRVLERSPGGHVKRLQVVGRDAAGKVLTATYEKDSQIRSMFSGRLGSTTALPSSTFVVLPRRENGQVTAWVIKGAGWGHGAGMCQRGAQNRAKSGWNARQILTHYFRGVSIQQLD